jgi:hypothetical protein
MVPLGEKQRSLSQTDFAVSLAALEVFLQGIIFSISPRTQQH